MERADVVVAGAGVIGLAVARAFAERGREVVVLESAGAIGTGASSRNSEVIHAGIYYLPGTLKARLCVEGKRRLYKFCDAFNVGHRRCGKLIVATDEAEAPALDAIAARAQAAGVDDLKRLRAGDAALLEPDVRCAEAFFSPSTGIVDSHAFMLALQGRLEDAGGVIAFETPVTGGRAFEDGVEVRTGGADPAALRCKTFVNAAGLGAQALAHSLEGFPAASAPALRLAKGSYFALQYASPFSHLIYPVPEDGGLGVHATLDLGGKCRFGPDVEWIEAPDYSVDPTRAGAFATAVRRYWPGLPDGALVPDYAGVRPKLSGPGEPPADFAILGPRAHRAGPMVHLFGVESPGLTASLAVADVVCSLLDCD